MLKRLASPIKENDGCMAKEKSMITVLTLLVALILGFASCQGGVEEIGSTSTSASRAGTNASVTGTVTYRERLTLTAGATLAVVLRDVSYADAAAPLIASHTITNPGHVPIQFKVDYNQDDIDPPQHLLCQCQDH